MQDSHNKFKDISISLQNRRNLKKSALVNMEDKDAVEIERNHYVIFG